MKTPTTPSFSPTSLLDFLENLPPENSNGSESPGTKPKSSDTKLKSGPARSGRSASKAPPSRTKSETPDSKPEAVNYTLLSVGTNPAQTGNTTATAETACETPEKDSSTTGTAAKPSDAAVNSVSGSIEATSPTTEITSPKTERSVSQNGLSDTKPGPSEAKLGFSDSKPMSVGELSIYIKKLLESNYLLSGVWVQGEISNLVQAASGHAYFTLKDSKGVIKAVLWAGNRRKVRVNFSNGSQVVVLGSISVYEPRGEYQLVVSEMKLAGLGALYEAFEKLKAKLMAEGLFDESRKIQIPFLPKGIGVVTSSTGAVIKDIFRVTRRRFPNIPIFLAPVKVQGDGSAKEIAAAIKFLDSDPRVDVIIVARGGGSLEDLWAFNEEITVRAIAACVKPIVSAVGHETDFTIADFVADKRAPTPSAAAEMVVPVKEELLKGILLNKTRLQRALRNKIMFAWERLKKAVSCRFLRNPSLFFSERKLKLANITRDLEVAFTQRLRTERHRIDLLSARLVSLNPTTILERGYIMVRDENNSVISSVNQLHEGSTVRLNLMDGTAEASITKVQATKN
ncbi:MAG: exodeoxyribonuclease VII large subunit [Candidatus Riflebacteria bacterium]|nr:exodeoxyribonuclease VII large subunit [Candidatus Riflebacteria bacterium]